MTDRTRRPIFAGGQRGGAAGLGRWYAGPFDAMTQMLSLSPGALFAGDFRVVRPMSQGGMGSVYEVEQLSTGAHRALKLMHPQLIRDPSLLRRFEQEARVGALIESEHVVQVLAAGHDPATHTPWLVMEFLRGDDLAHHVWKHGLLPMPTVVEIVNQLCHALEAAHRVNVVHRDLKPENVFVAEARREGVPFTIKVLDFGIAKVLAEANTGATSAIGTPAWMAPEQTRAGTAIGPWTDVWALGLIVFWLVTGRMYWKTSERQGTTLQDLLREILHEPLCPASQRAAELGAPRPLPPGFDGWLSRCVVREPGGRFFTIAEARAELLPLLRQGSMPGTGPRPAPVYVPTPPPYAAPPQAYPGALPYGSSGTALPYGSSGAGSPLIPAPPPARPQAPARSGGMSRVLLAVLGAAGVMVTVAAMALGIHGRRAASDDEIPMPSGGLESSADPSLPDELPDGGPIVVPLTEAPPPPPMPSAQAPAAPPPAAQPRPPSQGQPPPSQGSDEKRVGKLLVVTSPRAELVTVNGRGIGPAPAEALLPPGTYSVVARRSGYPTQSRMVPIKAGMVTKWTLAWE